LTTPPCTEGVLWYIGTKPLTITIETYIALKNTVKTNNRFTQSYRGDAAVEDILQIAAQGI
jgi:carbonic anhydrase